MEIILNSSSLCSQKSRINIKFSSNRTEINIYGRFLKLRILVCESVCL